MPKMVPEMTDAVVRRLRAKDGKVSVHAVGGVSGLLLVCKPTGSRSWILRTTVGGKRRDLGLGGYPDTTLAQARERARMAKDQIRAGIDPVAERNAARSALLKGQAQAVTFETLAAEYIAKKSLEFKTVKQTQKLTSHLQTYAYPHIGRLVVGDIERAHIVAMLEPIWNVKNETASRVRLHVERILDLAGAKGLRTGDNPARWAGNLELSLAKREKVAKVVHYKALPVDQMAEFWQKLCQQPWMGALALRFIVLTAGRSGEVRGAKWSEIDLEQALWRVPAERMKGGRAHTVPLTPAAIDLLNSIPRIGEHVFTGVRGGPLTDATISKVPKRIGYDVTAHGFRATFRTWAQEHTNYADEVCELALAHVNSDSTRAAYARGELVDKRRLLMADWARFCETGAQPTASVRAIR